MDLNYTLFTLGNVQLHLLHTPKGNFFVAAEVAQRLFRESIVVFQKVHTHTHTHTHRERERERWHAMRTESECIDVS